MNNNNDYPDVWNDGQGERSYESATFEWFYIRTNQNGKSNGPLNANKQITSFTRSLQFRNERCYFLSHLIF